MNLLFRDGCAADGEQLLQIHTRAIMELGQGFYPHDELISWAHGLSADGYGRVMQDEHYEVACEDERIIGFCGTQDDEITALYVDPDRARQGIGSVLMERAVARLRARYGMNTLRLVASLSALDFYQRHGWQETRRWMQPSRGGLPMVSIDMELPCHLRA